MPSAFSPETPVNLGTLGAPKKAGFHLQVEQADRPLEPEAPKAASDGSEVEKKAEKAEEEKANQPVPEPSVPAILVAGFALLLCMNFWRGRRRRLA